MCKQDVDMGRATQASQTTVSVGAGVAQAVLGPDPYRFSMVLTPPATGSLTYSIRPDPTNGDGLVFHTGSSPLTLTIKDHGDMVRKPWYVYSTNAGVIGVLSTQFAQD